MIPVSVDTVVATSTQAGEVAVTPDWLVSVQRHWLTTTATRDTDSLNNQSVPGLRDGVGSGTSQWVWRCGALVLLLLAARLLDRRHIE